MTLYLDTEFNGFGGELISLALISSVTMKEWYEVLPCDLDNLHPWVEEHVMPFLGKGYISKEKFKASLWEFMREHQQEAVIADWPEDLGHLMMQMCDIGGIMPKIEQLDMRLINSGKLYSAIPHNALEDARALMQWHVAQYKGEHYL